MTSPNGKLTEAELLHVSHDETLSNLTGNAYRRLVIAGQKAGVKVTLASPGAGYRSLFVQQDMHDHPARWDLNPASSVGLAAAGYSTHGTGTRADLLFNGSSNPTAAHLKLADSCGFTREFGARDPNHFRHDGRTAIQPLTDAQVAAARLYPHEDGKPAPHPASASTYVVKDGDTLSGIAERQKVAGGWQKLASLNGLHDPYVIHPGQKLRLK